MLIYTITHVDPEYVRSTDMQDFAPTGVYGSRELAMRAVCDEINAYFKDIRADFEEDGTDASGVQDVNPVDLNWILEPSDISLHVETLYDGENSVYVMARYEVTEG